jgi:hypothetical protein
MTNPLEAHLNGLRHITRRHFLELGATGIGATALASLLGCETSPAARLASARLTMRDPMAPLVPHYPAKAKRVIFLHMAGAPSQLELFDYKPVLARLDGQLCPESLLEGKRFAFIKGIPKMLGPQATFAQHGESRAWVSDRMPHLAKVVDELAFLKAMHTDQFNHAPAQLLVQTGGPQIGRPSIGSWVTYGLGTENQNLPGFVVLLSGGSGPDAGASVYGSGFLPTVYQGVQCRSAGDPVLYLSDPDGVPRELRKASLDAINTVNRQQYDTVGDPEISTRIAQYEMAFRMQLSVPDAMDISTEPASVHALYGTTPGKTSYANNCLLARRLAERGVRFIQLFHWGWDSHGAGAEEALNVGFHERCKETDRATAALIMDLRQRGLLEDTLIVWGGEFGRTPMRENRTGTDNPFVGRDHNPGAFTMWMAGGGIRGGVSHGETDEIGYQGISGKTDVHDLHATILHLLGFDHERLIHTFQGRNYRLTDTAGKVVRDVLA